MWQVGKNWEGMIEHTPQEMKSSQKIINLWIVLPYSKEGKEDPHPRFVSEGEAKGPHCENQ